MSIRGTWLAGLLAVLVVACGAWVFWQRGHASSGGRLSIYQNGTLVEEVDLAQVSAPYTIELTGPQGSSNTVQIEPGRVCISHSTCPDQVCVHQGWISDGTVPIVCLPNQVILQIEGGGRHVDTIAG